MTRIPKIIHFTVPKILSESQKKAIAIAQELHTGWRIAVWQDPLDPADFELGSLWTSTNSGAQLADLIRLEVVYREGGIYLDSDMFLQRNLDSLLEYQFFATSEDGYSLTNAAFGAVQHSEVLRSLIDVLKRDGTIDWKMDPAQTTGPGLFSRELRWKNEISVLPRVTFYPYNWNEKVSPPHRLSYGTHKWEKSWKTIDRLPPTALSGGVKQLVKRLIGPLRKQLAKRHNSERWIRLTSGEVRAYAASGDICVNTIHGYRMIVNGADVSVSPHIVSKGYYELTEELFLKKILKGGDWTVDVGANIGVFSLLMAHQVGPFGRVFSFEPNPECARLLRKSCVMNWMHERVKVTEAAVGDQADSATLSFHSDRLGDGTVLPAEKQGVFGESIAFVGGAKQINVPIVRLDDEFEVDLPIRFLKIDAEGFEHRILNGASRLIRNRCFDFIMVEVLRDVARHQWVELCAALKLLEEAGYTPHVLIQNGRVTPTSVHAVIHGNTKGGRNFIFKSVDATL